MVLHHFNAIARPCAVTKARVGMKRTYSELGTAIHRNLEWLWPRRSGFYADYEKRSFFGESSLYRSLALADGSLYGGCLSPSCPTRCVPLATFAPDDDYARAHFDAALCMHADAVYACDLDVARENRQIAERFRCDVCPDCRRPRLMPPADARVSDDGDGSGSESEQASTDDGDSSQSEQDADAASPQEPARAADSGAAEAGGTGAAAEAAPVAELVQVKTEPL